MVRARVPREEKVRRRGSRKNVVLWGGRDEPLGLGSGGGEPVGKKCSTFYPLATKEDFGKGCLALKRQTKRGVKRERGVGPS